MQENIVLKRTAFGPSPVILGLALVITCLYAFTSVLLLEDMLRHETAIAVDGEIMLYGLLPLIISGLPWSTILAGMHTPYVLLGPLVNLFLLIGLLWFRERRHARALADALVTLSTRSFTPPVRGWCRFHRFLDRSDLHVTERQLNGPW